MRHQFEPLSAKIIEAAIEVHRELGPGFLESIYESAVMAALRHRGIVYRFFTLISSINFAAAASAKRGLLMWQSSSTSSTDP